jgi:hypothetical protein
MTFKSPFVDTFQSPFSNPFGESVVDTSVLHPNEIAVFDVTDSASYSGTGQTWTDVVNGHTIFRGADGTTEAGDDPIFNGTAGTDSAYWNTDVNDSRYFTVDSITEKVEKAYKAGTVLTFVEAVKKPTSNDFVGMYQAGVNNTSSGGYRGVYLLKAITTGGYLRVWTVAGGTQVIQDVSSGGSTMEANGGNLLIIATIDLSTGDLTVWFNGSKQTATMSVAHLDSSDDTLGYPPLINAARNTNGSTFAEMPANGYEQHAWAVIDGSISDADAATIKTRIEALTGRTYS